MSGPSPSTKDKVEHVFVISWLPFRHNPREWKNAWIPVKDLIRSLLHREFQGQSNGRRDDLRVNVHSYCVWYYASAVLKDLKEEQQARKIFGCLAGSSWHGSTLTVVWIKVIPNHSAQYMQASNESSRPVHLESISPIKDTRLLWTQPLALPNPSVLWSQVSAPAPLFPTNLRGLPGPRALGVIQNNPLSRSPQIRGAIGGSPNQRTDHMQAQLPTPEYPYAAFAPFYIDQQQLQQIEDALSRCASINETQFWTPGSTVQPVALSTNLAWPSSSQSVTQPTPAFGSNSMHQPRRAIPQPIAGPPMGGPLPGTHRAGRHSGPPIGSARSAPLNQRKKAIKEGKKREAREGPEKKRMDSGPVIADGSGEGPA